MITLCKEKYVREREIDMLHLIVNVSLNLFLDSHTHLYLTQVWKP